MKKLLYASFLLSLFFSISVQAQNQKVFSVLAKDLRFVAVDGPGFCNGIKAYKNDQWLFNLGYPECPNNFIVVSERVDFECVRFSCIQEIADYLNLVVQKSDLNQKLYLVLDLWTSLEPTHFIWTEDDFDQNHADQ